MAIVLNVILLDYFPICYSCTLKWSLSLGLPEKNPGDLSFPASTPSRSGVRTGEGTEEKNGSAKGALATVEVEPINGVPLERLVDSMDWVSRENLNRKPWFYMVLTIKSSGFL